MFSPRSFARRLTPFLATLALAAPLAGCGIETVIITPPDNGGPSIPPVDGGLGGPTPDASPDPSNQRLDGFHIDTFFSDIEPQLFNSCVVAGCHAEGSSARPPELRPPSDYAGPAYNLEKVIAYIDLSREPFDARATEFYVKAVDSHLGTVIESPEALEQWILDAYDYTVGPPQFGRFDREVFETQVQPMLDAGGCAVAGCHGDDPSVGGFHLNLNAAPGSVESGVNLQNVIEYVRLEQPGEQSVIYLRATDGHRGTVISDPEVLVDWIEAARATPAD